MRVRAGARVSMLGMVGASVRMLMTVAMLLVSVSVLFALGAVRVAMAVAVSRMRVTVVAELNIAKAPVRMQHKVHDF